MSDLTERTCKNADGQIVLTYYMWIAPVGFNIHTQVYCDGQFTKGWMSISVGHAAVQQGSVDWPAEKVWCNKKVTVDWLGDASFGSATVWNEEVDYNTEYCGGTASKVTFVEDETVCKY